MKREYSVDPSRLDEMARVADDPETAGALLDALDRLVDRRNCTAEQLKDIVTMLWFEQPSRLPPGPRIRSGVPIMEVARRLGISRWKVRRRERWAFEQLRELLTPVV